MNWLVRFAVRLYPSSWRQRYGREFEALLEDVKPGWRGLSDIIYGAVTMQIRRFGTIPVVCALAGAIGGGIIAMRTPEVFASSATIRLPARDLANAGSAAELSVPLDKALAASHGTRQATSVTVQRGHSANTILKLTYLDRDPAKAQHVARTLTAAIETENKQGAASAEVLAAPDFPTTPIAPDYPATVASGGGLGLIAGSVVLLLLRARRRPASAA
jgi:uncharacterized protein involved in exopolysaccharide biosynthesis